MIDDDKELMEKLYCTVISDNLAIPPHLFISEQTNIAIENMLKDFQKQFSNAQWKTLHKNEFLPPEDY